MLGRVVGANFYHIYSYSTTICSIIFNAALIRFLLNTRGQSVGPYRWLLLSFSVVDVCISLVHSIMIPAAHLTEFGMICFGYRFVDQPTSIGFWGSLTFVFLFYQTFILLAFHYVYRFVVLCNPSWLSIMNKRPWRNWISLALLVDFIYSGLICAAVNAGFAPTEKSRRAYAPVMKYVYDIDLYSGNMPGYLGVTYFIPLQDGAREWQLEAFISVGCAGSIIFAPVAVIFYSIKKIMKEMRTVQQLESTTRHMQRRLFRALLWQTIIPTCSSYIPVAFVLIMPLFQYQLGGLGTVGLMSTQLFPMIDPFLIMYFLRGNRSSVARLPGPSTTIEASVPEGRGTAPGN